MSPAINSAVQVNLLGQAAADTIGPSQFTGTGGQVDFMRGAARSRGAKAVIALPSAAKDGSVSRIVASVGSGSAIDTMRADVDYVVTGTGSPSCAERTWATVPQPYWRSPIPRSRALRQLADDLRLPPYLSDVGVPRVCHTSPRGRCEDASAPLCQQPSSSRAGKHGTDIPEYGSPLLARR